MRATRWMVAALIGSAMTTIGCAAPRVVDESATVRAPVVADDSLAYAFDTQLERRVLDRLDLDAFLRERAIEVHVAEGVVALTGEVWTPLEKQRAADLMRQVAGVMDVENGLVVRAPD